ncbi:hypothetical protein TRVA0_055S00408 [Trichomonascus vanleenenianus]|uniref:uncharacterized protein n=1 Tax=Trichomonascus vanleenenianus TaxID=2268995 RepID=UPI003EC981AD
MLSVTDLLQAMRLLGKCRQLPSAVTSVPYTRYSHSRTRSWNGRYRQIYSSNTWQASAGIGYFFSIVSLELSGERLHTVYRIYMLFILLGSSSLKGSILIKVEHLLWPGNLVSFCPLVALARMRFYWLNSTQRVMSRRSVVTDENDCSKDNNTHAEQEHPTM